MPAGTRSGHLHASACSQGCAAQAAAPSCFCRISQHLPLPPPTLVLQWYCPDRGHHLLAGCCGTAGLRGAACGTDQLARGQQVALWLPQGCGRKRPGVGHWPSLGQATAASRGAQHAGRCKHRSSQAEPSSRQPEGMHFWAGAGLVLPPRLGGMGEEGAPVAATN